MEKIHKNILENTQETEGIILVMIDEVKNNFNEFSELSVSFIYACLQLLI